MNQSLLKNQIYTVSIEDLTFEAYGVARINGMTIFVENVLPGEVCEIRIERIEKRFAFGKMLKLIESSPSRVQIKDKVGTRIGTMPLQHMAYSQQLIFKRDIILSCFNKVYPIEVNKVENTLGMENPWYYRNKAQIPVRNINNRLETGFFKRNSHDLIPIENFYIQDPIIDESIIKIRDILREYNIEAYDENNHSGNIRHIIVRRGQVTGELMVILVTAKTEIPKEKEVVDAIANSIPGLVSLVHNINSKKTNVIMGPYQRVLYGKDFYKDTLLGKTYAISSRSFYQINTIQTEVLYSKAIELAGITKQDVVIDAYCGIGTITLSAADYAKHVYGVEIVEDAIKMARDNAKFNGVENVTFEAGAAEYVMESWIKQGVRADVVIVDPPRKGLAQSFIKSLIQTNPRTIVYVSCNPVTLAKDVKQLCESGYSIEVVQPVDMFPQTTHIETVCLLKRY